MALNALKKASPILITPGVPYLSFAISRRQYLFPSIVMLSSKFGSGMSKKRSPIYKVNFMSISENGAHFVLLM